MTMDKTSVKRPLTHNGEDTDTPPVKRPRYNYNDTISVLVGPDEEEFTVHKDVVCARSKFFRAACSQRWRDGRLDKAVRLPDADPATFQMYMDALYHRLIYDKEASSKPLVKLYLLGDFLDDVKLRNEAMELLQLQKFCPSHNTIAFVWANTVPGSLIRNWIVDGVIPKLSHPHFANFIAAYPAEFVQHVAVSLHGLARGVIESKNYFEVESDDDVDA